MDIVTYCESVDTIAIVFKDVLHIEKYLRSSIQYRY